MPIAYRIHAWYVYMPTFTIKNHRNVGKYTPDPVGYDPWIGSSYKFTNRGISRDGILSFSFVAWCESYFWTGSP